MKHTEVLTVDKLRKALENVPDHLEVRLGSDTGVDQGLGKITVEMARRVKYELPNGQRFDDTGETGVDYFEIYANDNYEKDEDENEE